MKLTKLFVVIAVLLSAVAFADDCCTGSHWAFACSPINQTYGNPFFACSSQTCPCTVDGDTCCKYTAQTYVCRNALFDPYYTYDGNVFPAICTQAPTYQYCKSQSSCSN